MSKPLDIIFFSFLNLFLILVHPCNGEWNSKKARLFRGMFVFGNSITDAGNNNFLTTPAKANYLPYGIDFLPGGGRGRFLNGRFTNGENQADCIGDVVGLSLLPPFSNPYTKTLWISSGVNYASAASGILDSTGSTLGVISLSQQIRNFVEGTLPILEGQQGCPRTNLLPHYLFLFATGSNDFLSFFLSHTVTLEFFTANLTSSLATQITRLYNVGVRKFAFLNIGPIGCSPLARAAMPNKACNEIMNYAAFLFNTHLIRMLDAIRSRMPGFQFIVVNFFQISLEFITNPLYGGFSNVRSPCCEVSVESGGILCRIGGSVCSNRSNYMYFDGLNPTKALYGIVADRAYNSNSTSEVYPFNLQRLASLSTQLD